MKGRKYLSPSDAMQTFVLGLAFFLGVNLIAGVAIAAVNLTGGDVTAITWVGVAVSTSSLLVLVAIYCSKKEINFFEATTLNVKPHMGATFLGFLTVTGLIFALMPLVFAFITFLTEHGLLTGGSADSIFPENPDAVTVIFYILVVCALPSFCEEVLMRGIIAKGFARRGIIFASLISGFVFMLFHMNPAQTIYQFVLGVVLAFYMLRGGSVWTAILMHFYNNVLAIIMDLLLSAEIQEKIFVQNWYICVAAGAVVAAAGIVMFIKLIPNRFDKDYEIKQRQIQLDSLPVRHDLVYEEEKLTATLPRSGSLEKFLFIVALLICALMWVAALFV